MRYLFLLFFIPAFCQGQDTIVTRSGRKIVGKIRYVNENVHFKYLGDTAKQKYKIELYHIQYLHYADGSKETYNPAWTDSTKDMILIEKRFPPPFISFSIGTCIPTGPYGGSTSEPISEYLNLISGYASTGISYSLTADIPFNSAGWSFSIKGGYIVQHIDAPGLIAGMQEFYDFTLNTNSAVTDYSVSNNYYYHQLLLLAGLSKSFKTTFSTVTICAMTGDLAYDMPSITGTALFNSNYNRITYYNLKEVYTLSGGATNMLAFDLGVILEQKLNKHFSLRESFDYIASWTQYDGISSSLPNILVYPNNSWDEEIQRVELLTADVGLKYTF